MHDKRKTEDNPDAKGLAFLIHPKLKDRVTDFKTYSNRVTKMEVNLRKIFSYSDKCLCTNI